MALKVPANPWELRHGTNAQIEWILMLVKVIENQ